MRDGERFALIPCCGYQPALYGTDFLHPFHPVPQSVEVRVHDRRHVQRDELREGEAADHREAERPPRFRARDRKSVV